MSATIEDEPFQSLCALWEKISNPLLKPRQKLELLEEFIHSFPRNADGYFSLFRLLLPALDRERGTYGLREVVLSRVYAEVFVLPTSEAKRLRYYRDPSRVASTSKPTRGSVALKVGDFPSILFAVLEDRVSIVDKSKLSIKDVNIFLDGLCCAAEMPSKLHLFRDKLKHATALHHKWICRIILKDLKIGIGHERILRILSPNLADAYNVLGDLKETIEKYESEFKGRGGVWTGNESSSEVLGDLSSVVMKVFRPLKPMLAKRLPLANAEEFLFGGDSKNSKYSMEPKLDGERLLCHFARRPGEVSGSDIDKSGDNEVQQAEAQIVFFTRRGNSEYPSAYVSHFSELLETAIKVEEVILDGEILVWNRLTEQLIPFGSARSVGSGKLEEADLFYVIFDVLHVKNKGKAYDVLALPWYKRRELLKKIITAEVTNRLEIVHSEEITNAQQIHRALKEVVEDRGEGIMVKAWDSQYCLNTRDAGWYKMKPEFGWLADSLDLLVIGCFLSDGVRRRKKTSTDPIDHISTFLLATLNEDKESVSTFAKVGTGYTFEELRDMIDIMRPHLMPLGPRDQLPEWAPNWKPSGGSRPDFILDHFTNGFVMEVIGAEIVESDAFGLGHTIRFPRAARGKAIRKDKTWEECEPTAAIRSLIVGDHTRKRRRSRASDASDNESDAGARRRSKNANKQPSHKRRPDLYLDIGGVYEDANLDVDTVKIEVPVFQGKLVHILPFSILKGGQSPGAYVRDKRKLEQYLTKAGAKITQTYSAGLTDYIIADRPSVRSSHLNQTNNMVVYNILYAVDSIAQGKLLDPDPKYVIHPNKALKAVWDKFVDQYGDWYTRQLESTDELMALLDKMETPTPENRTPNLSESMILKLHADEDISFRPETAVSVAVWSNETSDFISLTEADLENMVDSPSVDFDLRCHNPARSCSMPPSLANLVLPSGLRTAIMKFARHSILRTQFLLQARRLLLDPHAILIGVDMQKDYSDYKQKFLLIYPDNSGRDVEAFINESTDADPIAQKIVALRSTFPNAKYFTI